MGFLHRHPWLTPYLLLVPGLAWLAVFFIVPLGFLAYQSLETGSFDVGYAFDWSWGNYWDGIDRYRDQLIRSLLYAGLATVFAFGIGYPLAYWIAFRGGRWKSLFLILIIAPFFVTYLIRTLAWQTILADRRPGRRVCFATSASSGTAAVSSPPRRPSWRGSPTTSCRSWCCRCTCPWSRSTSG